MGRLTLMHPVPMRAEFRECFLVNFSLEPDVLAARLPRHLMPDIHDGRAFLSIVIAQIRGMRPSLLPELLGVDYTQVVYRAVVTCGGQRGVYFLRSDADNALMALAGTALTFFRFHWTRVEWKLGDGITRFSLRPRRMEAASIEAEFESCADQENMPASSRFRNLPLAQSFLTELYVAFGPKCSGGKADAVRIDRSEWTSLLVRDRIGKYEAMSSGVLFGAGEAELDSVLHVRSMKYRWHRGSTFDAARPDTAARRGP